MGKKIVKMDDSKNTHIMPELVFDPVTGMFKRHKGYYRIKILTVLQNKFNLNLDGVCDNTTLMGDLGLQLGDIFSIIKELYDARNSKGLKNITIGELAELADKLPEEELDISEICQSSID